MQQFIITRWSLKDGAVPCLHGPSYRMPDPNRPLQKKRGRGRPRKYHPEVAMSSGEGVFIRELDPEEAEEVRAKARELRRKFEGDEEVACK